MSRAGHCLIALFLCLMGWNSSAVRVVVAAGLEARKAAIKTYQIEINAVLRSLDSFYLLLIAAWTNWRGGNHALAAVHFFFQHSDGIELENNFRLVRYTFSVEKTCSVTLWYFPFLLISTKQQKQNNKKFCVCRGIVICLPSERDEWTTFSLTTALFFSRPPPIGRLPYLYQKVFYCMAHRARARAK